MPIRKTNETDLNVVMLLFEKARKTMATLNIDQWQDGYPFREDIERDIQNGESYVLTENETVIGTFMLMKRTEPTYATVYDGKWLTAEDMPYATVHRITVDPAYRASAKKSGNAPSASKMMVDYAKNFARVHHLPGGVKVDTHKGNLNMRKMLEKNGFVYCGVILLANGDERVAYQYIENS